MRYITSLNKTLLTRVNKVVKTLAEIVYGNKKANEEKKLEEWAVKIKLKEKEKSLENLIDRAIQDDNTLDQKQALNSLIYVLRAEVGLRWAETAVKKLAGSSNPTIKDAATEILKFVQNPKDTGPLYRATHILLYKKNK